MMQLFDNDIKLDRDDVSSIIKRIWGTPASTAFFSSYDPTHALPDHGGLIYEMPKREYIPSLGDIENTRYGHPLDAEVIQACLDRIHPDLMPPFLEFRKEGDLFRTTIVTYDMETHKDIFGEYVSVLNGAAFQVYQELQRYSESICQLSEEILPVMQEVNLP